LPGDNFGHHKAGTFSNIINSVHTVAIPLKTGFSYNWWRKGINVMLEISPPFPMDEVDEVPEGFKGNESSFGWPQVLLP